MRFLPDNWNAPPHANRRLWAAARSKARKLAGRDPNYEALADAATAYAVSCQFRMVGVRPQTTPSIPLPVMIERLQQAEANLSSMVDAL